MDPKILATTDEPPAPQPKNFWVPHFIIAGFVVSAGAVITMFFGPLAG